MPFFTKEQKDSLGPFLAIGTFVLAACGGLAIYDLAGGEPIPFFSPFAAVVCGIVGFVLLLKALRK